MKVGDKLIEGNNCGQEKEIKSQAEKESHTNGPVQNENMKSEPQNESENVIEQQSKHESADQRPQENNEILEETHKEEITRIAPLKVTNPGKVCSLTIQFSVSALILYCSVN